MSLTDQNKMASKVWNDHDREEYRQDQSHWRGVGRWMDDSKWQAIGKYTRSRIKQAFYLANKKFDENCKIFTTLEWGPGGGANMYSFMDISSK